LDGRVHESVDTTLDHRPKPIVSKDKNNTRTKRTTDWVYNVYSAYSAFGVQGVWRIEREKVVYGVYGVYRCVKCRFTVCVQGDVLVVL